MNAHAVYGHERLVLPSVKAEVGEHELRNVVPKLKTRLNIDPRVLPRVDAAQAGLGCNVVIADKAPSNA
jgi:hypothetical protein